MDWYYGKDGRQMGPVTAEGLAQLLRSGVITPDSLVWHAGMAEWQSYRLATGMPPAPGLRPGPGGLAYGGFWIRFFAYVLDGFLIGIIRAALVAPMGWRLLREPAWSWGTLADIGQIQITSLAVSLCYFALFWTKYGATPGKMLFRLKVVNAQGGSLTLGQSIGRYFSMLLSGLILCFGFIMAAFDPEARTLHDRLADTRVVREN